MIPHPLLRMYLSRMMAGCDMFAFHPPTTPWRMFIRGERDKKGKLTDLSNSGGVKRGNVWRWKTPLRGLQITNSLPLPFGVALLALKRRFDY